MARRRPSRDAKRSAGAALKVDAVPARARVTLSHVLGHPPTARLFQKYLRRERSSENYEFYVAVKRFVSKYEIKAREESIGAWSYRGARCLRRMHIEAKQIYKRHIRLGSKYAVNISYKARAALDRYFQGLLMASRGDYSKKVALPAGLSQAPARFFQRSKRRSPRKMREATLWGSTPSPPSRGGSAEAKKAAPSDKYAPPKRSRSAGRGGLFVRNGSSLRNVFRPPTRTVACHSAPVSPTPVRPRSGAIAREAKSTSPLELETAVGTENSAPRSVSESSRRCLDRLVAARRSSPLGSRRHSRRPETGLPTLRDRFEAGLDVFRDATREVFSLMESDSLRRFLRAYPETGTLLTKVKSHGKGLRRT